jgi:hypothetical protein
MGSVLRSGSWVVRFFLLAASLAVFGCGDDDVTPGDGGDVDDVAETLDEGGGDAADGDEGPDGDADADGDDVTDEGADDAVPPWNRTLVVLTSDYAAGGITAIDVDSIGGTLRASVGASTAHADAMLRCLVADVPERAGDFFVVERLGADRLRRMKVDNGVVSEQAAYSFEAGSNPQDAVLLVLDSVEQVAVPLYERTTLAFLAGDLSGIDGTVDLGPLADAADGLPEMYRAVRREGLLLVSLQLLDRGGTTWTPTGPGVLAAVSLDGAGAAHALLDLSADAGVQGVRLFTANPTGPMRPVSDGTTTRLFVSTVGAYGANDGALEVVGDPMTGSSAGVVVSEEALGGDLSDWIVTAGGPGFALVTVGFATDRIVRFQPVSGLVDPEPVVEAAGYSLAGLVDLGDGRIAVGDRTAGASGIRVFDASTKTELTAAPIDVGLPPVMACVAE